ncbi:MAG: M28 family peptidase [Planctomycetaceae bacterium]
MRRQSVSMFRFLAAYCCLVLPLESRAQYPGAEMPPPEFRQGFDSISEADSEAWLSVLVGTEYSGRGTGQEGYLLAARWYADRLAELGFQPAGTDGSWFQAVPFTRTEIVSDSSAISAGDTKIVDGTELGLAGYFGTFVSQLPVVFARVKQQRPDVAEGEFTDKLLVIQSEGRIRPGDEFLVKTNPACVLIVSRSDRIRSQAVSQPDDSAPQRATAMISTDVANRLASHCGASDRLFTDDDPGSNLVVTSSVRIDCSLSIERESVDVPNVVGWYPGSDESVRNEHVCIGAHLDHLGEQQGSVYPGADDNGSGSTALLQLAKAIHVNPQKPKRSVLLLAFCAEERGLLGSRYYADHPLRPLSDMICMLNIDMVGRNEESDTEAAADNTNTIHLVGSKRLSDDLHDLTLQANRCVNFVFEYDEEDVYTRSDHASFAKQGVPVTFLFGGFNPHYHKPTDTLDGINFCKIANCARLDYLTLMMAAEHGHFARKESDDKAGDSASE